MGSGDLHKGGSVTLNGSGNGTITLQPDNAQQSWQVTYIAISTNQSPTATIVPQVTAYVNTPMSVSNNRGASWSGNQTSFSGLIKVGPCDTLYVVFAAGVPGTIGSAAIEGTYLTRRGRPGEHLGGHSQ
jgi:hypothetical protein